MTRIGKSYKATREPGNPDTAEWDRRYHPVPALPTGNSRGVHHLSAIVRFGSGPPSLPARLANACRNMWAADACKRNGVVVLSAAGGRRSLLRVHPAGPTHRWHARSFPTQMLAHQIRFGTDNKTAVTTDNRVPPQTDNLISTPSFNMNGNPNSPIHYCVWESYRGRALSGLLSLTLERTMHAKTLGSTLHLTRTLHG